MKPAQTSLIQEIISLKIGQCFTCIKFKTEACEMAAHASKHPYEGCMDWDNGHDIEIKPEDIIIVEKLKDE